MGKSCFAVHGVSMSITIDGNVSVAQVFPSLFALPWQAQSADCWQIHVSCARTVPGRDDAPAAPPVILRVWPDIDIACRHDSAGVFHASLEGAALHLDFRAKKARLDCVPNTVKEAEKLGRLLVLEILRSEGSFMVHAAGVETGGGVVLICGASGTGKSTLVTAWACLGNARFLAEDRCVIFRRDGTLWAGGIADRLGLSPSSITLLTELGIRLPSNARQEGGKLFYDCGDLFLSPCQNPYPAKAILFLDHLPGNGADIRPCAPEEAFHRIWQASFYLGTSRAMQAHFDMLAELSAHVPAYLLRSRADCRETIAGLDHLMTEHLTRAYSLDTQAEQRSLRVHPSRTIRATRTLCRILADPGGEAGSAPLEDGEWRGILQSADRNGLLPLLAAILADHPSLRPGYDPPDNVLRVALCEAFAARRIHLDILAVLGAVFRPAGIQWAVMDGPSIAERFYRVPASRCYHRLRLLVAPGTMARAEESLRSLGFSPGRETSAQRLSHEDDSALIFRNAARHYEICLPASRGGHASRGRPLWFDVPTLLETAEMLSVKGIEVPLVCQSDQILLSCMAGPARRQKDALVHQYDVALMARSVSREIFAEVLVKADPRQCRDLVERGVQLALHTFPGKGPEWLSLAPRHQRGAAARRQVEIPPRTG